MLVAECAVFILGEHFDLVLRLHAADLSLPLRVSERLRDWIVLHFLTLYKLIGDFLVGLRLALEVLFLLVISLHVALPSFVAILEAHGTIRFSESVTSRHSLNYFLY